MNEHQRIYREEAQELLAELESCLLELENTPEDMELIGQAFRALHTIKGSGAMFGFDAVAAFTHEIESVFDRVRDGKVPVTKHLIDNTLSACDLIRSMIDDKAVDPKTEKAVISVFQELLPKPKPLPEFPEDDSLAHGEGEETAWRIRFRPSLDLYRTGTNPALLFEELRLLGDCQVALHKRAVPDLESIDPESCYLCWDIFLNTSETVSAIRDVFIFVEEHCELTIEQIDGSPDPAGDGAGKKLGEILVDRGDVSPETVNQVLGSKKRIGELLVEAAAIDREELDSALMEQEHLRAIKKNRENVAFTASIRVAAEKLDTLVDLVGELVTVRARLTRKASLGEDTELTAIAEEVERLSAELRDTTMNIRMLPVGNTFRKFKRLVHDLANELGKEVSVIAEGEETELDKTVLEQIGDPLVHIIRNAVDHGIEPPDVRKARGKPRQGLIRLSAVHSGSGVEIRISDDGAGLDAGAIRRRAVEKGLIAPDENLKESDLHELVFAPGFSTAEKVSGVSGRGVGMDVVKRKVENLRGRVAIHSHPNAGSTVTLHLPLTLAITDGLLVKVGGADYILPLTSVEACVEMSRSEADKARDRNFIDCRGDMISYINLRDLFQAGDHPPDREKVVIVKANGDRVGLGVDQVVGQLQTVIKSLGRLYKDEKRVSGATILGDGNVALILDVGQIMRTVQH